MKKENLSTVRVSKEFLKVVSEGRIKNGLKSNQEYLCRLINGTLQQRYKKDKMLIPKKQKEI